ncbi:FkbM family methyltransferase [Pelagicoccus sp. SDUM812003]|uniref:FkbM family methyltransferase n=1 Tax=Pelagicoccus sp. SDUM812003 TaxID=3041267 RepID=UPI00280D9C43|nr:FkbM family methyltransferase [Pelagicoccus sp. SDUM812003]MDQ8205600.1 FkbM family methyltransferase [Pelagicoccus sp. SDUM812003]
MNRTLKTLATNICSKLLGPVRGFPTVATQKRDIENLLRLLRPVSAEKNLIRLGPSCDGGYLVPDDLKDIYACISPGVSTVSDFEIDCAERGMKVMLADRTVDQPPSNHPNFSFLKKHVGSYNDETYITIDKCISLLKPPLNSDLLLQMDIEGAEYETILNISPEGMSKFRIIVVEFHYLDQLWNRPFYRIASRVFEKILSTHACVHMHPNNCRPVFAKQGIRIPPLIEFTFYDRRRIAKAVPTKQFPHPLDADNTDFPTLKLPKEWYT